MADRLTRCRPVLGTFVEITADCEAAIESAFRTIGRVHALMSAHEPESDLSRINRFAHERAVDVDPWTASVLERALFWSKQSEGAFDPIRAGKSALERGLFPTHPGQPGPEACHWSWLEITGTSIRLLKPACIDLGGIAKGFAVDRAISTLKASESALGLVNAGGDIAGFGPQPWPIQIVEPESRRAIANVAICNGAVATSAHLPGGRADHLPDIDSRLVSATVCAPSAIDADALTKIVLSGSRFAARCLRLADAQAFVLGANGEIRAIQPERQAA